MAITLGYIKEQVQEYIKKGGDIYLTPRTDIPYYLDMSKYIKNLRGLKDKVDATFQSVYAECGVFYDEIYDGLYEALYKVAEANNGYIDEIRKYRTKDSVYDKCKRAAKQMGVRLDEWVATMTPYKLETSMVNVYDYVKNLKNELDDFVKDNSINNLRSMNPELYNKVRHFRKYATWGAFEDIEQALEFLGYNYCPENATRTKMNININELVYALSLAYPLKEIPSFDGNEKLGKWAIQHALYYDTNLTDFLADNGFNYKAKALNKEKLEVMKMVDCEKNAELREIFVTLSHKANFNYDQFGFVDLPPKERAEMLRLQKETAVDAVSIYYEKLRETTNINNK